jgi:hypothetical protein
MKKIAITSLASILALTVSAQQQVKPPAEPGLVKAVSTPTDAPLPPSPTVPPVPPFDMVDEVPPAPDAPPIYYKEDIPDDYKLFLKKNPTIRSLGWTNKSVIIRLKTGKEERYTLADEKSMKEVESKYGELPEAPPPPPPLPIRSKG